MNRLKIFIIVCTLATIGIEAHAKQVNEIAAQNIAAQFMKQRGIGTAIAVPTLKTPRRNASSTQSSAYYVFNAEQGKGFVIVSGDDRTTQVLGYSKDGYFDPSNVPENMQWWLDQYVEEIAMLDSGLITLDELATSSDPQPKATLVVEPLIKSQWGQDAPFYFQCPQVNSNYCVTGCTATAMAQVMYYYKWPNSTSKTIPEYTIDSNTYNALGTTTFNWSAMKDYYSPSETSTTLATNSAVAKLMHYCGQSVKMNYGTSSSNGHNSGEVFVDFFRYSTKARQLFRFDYSYSDWNSYIQAELKAKRPVIYTGFKHQGGHCFILDGCDGTGYYHFNWGWYGNNDGYFVISSLNPKGGGTGSIDGNNGYMMLQDIIIGLEPNTVSTTEKNSVAESYGIQVENNTYTRSNTSDPFSIKTTATYKNICQVSRTYNLSWGVYESDGFTRRQYYNSTTDVTLAGDEKTTISRNLNFGANLPNGTYYLRPISREKDNASWLPCHYSGWYYIKAVINGNTLTLTPANGNHMFINDVTASITSYSSTKKEGHPLEVSIKVTNNGFNGYIPLYLFANNKLVGANSLQLGTGYTASVKIGYTPTSSGTNTIKVASDKNGNYVYCTGSVNIDEATPGNLSMVYTVPNANSNYITNDNYLTFMVKITNNLNTAYNDFIIAKLYKKNDDGVLIDAQQKTSALYLSGSESKTVDFTFNDLKSGAYKAKFYYYNYTSQITGLSTIAFQVGAEGDVNGDGVCNAADVTALYNWILNNDDSALKFGDQNNDGVINAGDVTTVYNIILGK